MASIPYSWRAVFGPLWRESINDLLNSLQRGGDVDKLLIAESAGTLYLVPDTAVNPGNVLVSIQVERAASGLYGLITGLTGSAGYKHVAQRGAIPVGRLFDDGVITDVVAVTVKMERYAAGVGAEILEAVTGWLVGRQAGRETGLGRGDIKFDIGHVLMDSKPD